MCACHGGSAIRWVGGWVGGSFLDGMQEQLCGWVVCECKIEKDALERGWVGGSFGNAAAVLVWGERSFVMCM